VTAVQFIAYLRDVDVKVWAEGNRLRLSAPAGVVTPELREQLRVRKAELLAALQREGAEPATAPLSFAQQRLWFLDQLQPGSAAYHMTGAVRLRGALDPAALGRAMDEIVRRHAVLRTTFRTDGGQPVQVIHAAAPAGLTVTDLAPLAPSAREARVAELAREEAARPFDLARGPLLRLTLLRLAPAEHVLLTTMHHIVSDAWSMGVLVRELTAVYGAFAAGRPSPLAELPMQYADHARWQRRHLRGEALSIQLGYWTGKLGGALPVLDLPGDRPRPAVRGDSGAVERFALSGRLVGAVREVAQRERATPFMVLLAAFAALLHRYTGQTDVVIGTPIANRTRVEAEGLIGLYANTLALRIDLSGSPTFTELLRRVRATALEAYEHQDVPFEKLVEVLQPARDLSRSPLFDVMFGLQNAPMAVPALLGLALTPVATHGGGAKVDLALQLGEAGSAVGASLEYSTDLFDAATIGRLWTHYEALLEAVVADPERPIAALPILSPAERRLVLEAWQGPAADVPAVRWPALFERRVADTPDAIAAIAGDARVTYAELNRRANRLAHHLRALGVGPEVLVGVALDRSLDLLVALVGVLKAGGAYVPLDPEYPPERLAFMLADAGVAVLITHDVALPALPVAVPTLRLDRDAAALAAASAADPVPVGSPEDLAYVIYTSGSTGTPKGVEIPHRALVNLLLAMAGTPGLAAADVLLAVTSPSFDIAALELFLPLTVGARVVIAGSDAVVDGARLGALMDDCEASVVQATPSTWRLLLDSGWRGRSGLRVLSGGEALPAALAARLAATGAEVWNLYGPTETTIWSTLHAIRGDEPVVPIGRPIANTRAYVLDADGQPTPIGVPGELHLGGLGVARGYRDRPELTAERFVADPFAVGGTGRLYRTGDVVRWRADGALQFLGRRDQQVKIRGHRIELGEIEAALLRHPDVREAVVVAREAAPGDHRLVAYVVAAGAAPSAAALRSHLATTLPASMLPAHVVALPALPLTPNGKVDRAALPAPDARAGAAPVSRAPADEVERRLVEIWRETLGVAAVDPGDSFFEIGGHSLLAVELFARIEAAFGRRLPLATLFQAPSLAEQARLIRRGGESESRRSLVPIKAGAGRPPLFAVPGVPGIALGFNDLVRLAAPDQPFYALQSVGLDGEAPPLTRIEDIAAHFVREVRTVQPDGPYHLLGVCMGGVVTYEMAQQLHSTGQSVALLALVETWLPRPLSAPRLRLGGNVFLRFVAERLLLYAQTFARLERAERMDYLRSRLTVLRQAIAAQDAFRGDRSELHRARVSQANLHAFRQYVPRPYPGPVVVFRATGRRARTRVDRRLAWRDLATGGMHVHDVPGMDSGLVLREPNVRVFVDHLGTYLRDAFATGVSR
jgi:amino acid adenylation domain-containing protein